MLDRVKWPDREAPIARLRGEPVPEGKYAHVFGAYCLYHIPKKSRSGAFQPSSEMGVWVGSDPHVVGGHWVVPIKWDAEQQCWVLGELVTATTVRVYDSVKPLRVQPEKGKYGSQEFDTFIDKVFHPLLSGEGEGKVGEPRGDCLLLTA